MRNFRGLTLTALALAACGPTARDAVAEPRNSAVPAFTPHDSEGRRFRDWLAVCDNGETCAAFGPASEGSGWVRIFSSPGPDGARSVHVGLWPTTGDGPVGPVTLILDGQALVAASVEGDHPPVSAAVISPAETPAAISAIAAGRRLILSTGDETVPISLSGATAALLWIDERQGRLDTTTALVRRGVRPASAVPEAAPLPQVRAAPPAAQTGFGDSGQTLPAALEALAEVKACRAETGDRGDLREQVLSARLDDATELWAVPCFAGAYNVGHDWYVTGAGGRNPRPVELASSSGETAAGTINGAYDPDSRTLSAFAKGRGVGDCGRASTWTWTGQRFELSAESEMTECWGVPSDFWPTTWRTR